MRSGAAGSVGAGAGMAGNAIGRRLPPGSRPPRPSSRRMRPMRAVVQRVTSAAVTVAGEEIGRIGPGLCVLVGVTHDDDETVADRLAEKLWHLRVFDDDAGVMNRSAADVGAELLVVSQFTLYGDTSGGRRPSWIAAARPEHAEPLVDARRRRAAPPRRHRRHRAVPHRDAGRA